MNWKLMFPSQYLAAIEFGNRVFTAKIASVKLVKLESENGESKDKGVVFFEGHEKGWVLCKTNAMCVAAMFGDDTANWVGHSVTLYSTMVSVGKEKKPGIRVKGSPDIAAPVEVEIKLPRKKPFKVTMQPAGKGATPGSGVQAHQPNATAPADELPPPDNEPPDDVPGWNGTPQQEAP